MASHKAYLPFVSLPVAKKRYTSPTTAMVRPSVVFRIVGRSSHSVLPLVQCFSPIRIRSSFIAGPHGRTGLAKWKTLCPRQV